MDLDLLRQWVGRERRATDEIDVAPARALAAALDRTAAPRSGDALPAAWHWLYFQEAARASDLGADGHASLGDFLPPMPLPRRMWAAGDLSVLHPVQIGIPAERRSTVRAVEAKRGTTGPLLFLTIEHVVTQLGRECIRERQDLVYRELPAGPLPLPPGETAADVADWTRPVTPGPVLLFRYSALTGNAHRIHYDRPYATGHEHYPGLVVHGPLIVTLLLDLLAKRLPAATVTGMRFRALRPAFDGEPLLLAGCRRDGEVQLWTTDGLGLVGLRAVATLA